MTRQRNDNHSTEFGLWLRQQPELDSNVECFIASNLDYIWGNYRTGRWMLIEEKRYGADLTFSQKKQFRILHKAVKNDPNYCGFHLIQFENTNPEDGRVYVDRKEVTKNELLMFLRFNETFVRL